MRMQPENRLQPEKKDFKRIKRKDEEAGNYGRSFLTMIFEKEKGTAALRHDGVKWLYLFLMLSFGNV